MFPLLSQPPPLFAPNLNHGISALFAGAVLLGTVADGHFHVVAVAVQGASKTARLKDPLGALQVQIRNTLALNVEFKEVRPGMRVIGRAALATFPFRVVQ